MAAKAHRRVLAIASGGGHWVQLLRLRPAWERHDVAYACVRSEYAEDVPGARFFRYPDATRWDRVRLLWMCLRVAWIVLRVRPHVVISTGAAPGYAALRVGRLFGARTVWIDSVANVDELSMSGRNIGRHADLWLTQWSHLAQEGGPHYHGAVL